MYIGCSPDDARTRRPVSAFFPIQGERRVDEPCATSGSRSIPIGVASGVLVIAASAFGSAADRVVRFADQEAAIEVALEVNGVGATTRCGAGCTVHGAGTPAPVMTWIHAGAHVYPRGTSERIVSFFRDRSRAP